MPERNAIVLVLDRLGAGFLGPYGNTWLDTPAFNRFASQSHLFEFCLTHSPDLGEVYKAWWEESKLTTQLANAGVQATLVTDEPTVANLPAAAEFAEQVTIPLSGNHVEAESLEDCQLASFFATAIERIGVSGPNSLLWLHAQAMHGDWDAPYEFRQALADEDDPDPPTTIEPPHLKLAPNYDPDITLGLQQAYGAQVTVLDACLGVLLDYLQSAPLEGETLLCITSPRGYPLGEHLSVGGEELFGELLQTPLMIRTPDTTVGYRDLTLTCISDLSATLQSWFGLSNEKSEQTEGEQSEGRNLLARENPPEALIAEHNGQRSIRTAEWFLHDGEEQKLYAKPDDRWEVNNVADRCPLEVEELLGMMPAGNDE